MNAVVHPGGIPAGVALGGYYIPDFYSRFLGGFRAMALEPIGDIGDVSLDDSARPPDEDDLLGWYDATELSLSDTDSVGTWNDESGSNNLTQGTGSNQPTYRTGQIDGKPIVRFDGSSDFLTTAFSTVAQPIQTFAVAQFQSVSTESLNEWVQSAESGSSDRAGWGTRDNQWLLFAGNTLSGGAADTDPHIFNALWDGGSSKLDVDGTQVIQTAAGSEDLNGMTMGAFVGGTAHSEVDIGEYLIYPQDKTSVEDDAETYLSDKWGITVS